MKSDPKSKAEARPGWTYSVQAPTVLSGLWLLQLLSWLGVPIAIFSLIAGARYLGLVDFN